MIQTDEDLQQGQRLVKREIAGDVVEQILQKRNIRNTLCTLVEKITSQNKFSIWFPFYSLIKGLESIDYSTTGGPNHS